MTEKDFTRLQEKLNGYAFSSMEYLDYSDIEEYDIVEDNENVILLQGYHREAKCKEFHWASNSAEDVLKLLGNERPFIITFIPHEWVDTFEKAGLVIRDAWHDYFMDSLDSITEQDASEFLKPEDCEKASQVTISCMGQSRGFTGQTVEWVKEWITNSEEDSKESGTYNNAILTERNECNDIVGIVCTCTYGHDSKKGAIAWIREVAVNPEYQRRGIARRLIMQALSYGKSCGATRAFLAADECNIHAIHLYSSIGFRPSKENSQIDMMME
ncbi:MAG TPA: GNAT family N-acetyltransferase [Lachnospiraceae bacterium]|nr:GNAT family N-acetyltransferase [Lachnospiraceae bacterium]